MSAVRIRLGDVWLTGEPEQRQALVTSAGAVQFSARHNMTVEAGPDWPAQRPLDLMQRGVTLGFVVTRTFDDIVAMVTWLSDVLSLETEMARQGDVIIRWNHNDGIGYSEGRLPWGAVRFDSISHDGPQTLRLRVSVMAGEMEDHAVFALPHLLAEAGPRFLTESGLALRTQGDEYTLTVNP